VSETALVPSGASSAASTAALRNLRPPFPKGTSGNPSGRAKGQQGFAALIRQRTHQGRDLVSFAIGLMDNPRIDPRVRLDAAIWLADKGFGPADGQVAALRLEVVYVDETIR
jgi:hypothetical protein